MNTIGIDIGGTHTDMVVVNEERKIIHVFKTPTTFPLEEGVRVALKQAVDFSPIRSIHVGTTYAINALLEGKNLYKVGIIRIAGHRPDALRPCYGWPAFLKERLFAGYETVDGGYECDLREITPFSASQIKAAAERLLHHGAESFAIIGVFSPIVWAQEQEAAEAIRECTKNVFPISLSHEIGGIGFIQRENAVILNAALRKPMKEGFFRLQETVERLGIKVPIFLTQNNGSTIDLERAMAYPLLTVSSGPTNSFIGACRLAELTEAIVVDVGGTSTDIGRVENGYPRRSIHPVQIGGISLNFRSPDLLALAIGGGSHIKGSAIGPESCGHRLFIEGQVFGGGTLTLTDAACRAGSLSIPGTCPEAVQLSRFEAEAVLEKVRKEIHRGIMMMKGDKKTLPVLAVGGGASIAELPEVRIPEYHSVANAFGAALAEVSATVDTVVSLENRTVALKKLTEAVCEKAVSQGACSRSVRIVDLQVLPYPYVPNRLARVIVSASGEMRKPRR